jgi:hypothetical protein
MKVQIVSKTEPSIGGYERVEVGENAVDMSQYADNECEFILAGDILDAFPVTSSPPLAKYLASKVRIGGNLVVGGTDITLFCKNVLNRMVSVNEASDLISNKKSMSSPAMAIEALEAAGLKIQFSQTNGIHYEVTAAR